MFKSLCTTEVFDSYWRFAAERMAMFYRRIVDPIGPWTDDPILRDYRFTNAFRAADRVSQYLIREVQYREDRSQTPVETFFRTMLFKIFNRIETWEELERQLGPLSWQSKESLQQVADAVGISKAHVWELETGRSTNPSLEILQGLARHFNVTVAYFAENEPIADARTQGFLRSIQGKVSKLSDEDLEYLKGLADRLGGKNDR